MGKNRKKKGNVRPPGPRPQLAMRPAAPVPLRGAFRGRAPVRHMGPPGPRFPGPHHNFGPQPRMMMMMTDDMVEDRRFMHEQHDFMNDGPFPMDFANRHEFNPHFDGPNNPHFQHRPGFGNRPQEFFHPELEHGPRFRSPEFCDGPQNFVPPEFCERPPDFCPPEFDNRPPGWGRNPNFHQPEFEGGPGFRMMNPGVDQVGYGPTDPHFLPQMDVHGNHGFGERGGFAGPPLQAPCPVQKPPEALSATNRPSPACPPQPPKKKDQSATLKITTFKNICANTPRGRSLGVISYVGNSCGFIEREDLKKFSFVFDAFIGKRSLMMPGVKVHFTVVKNMGKECAADVTVVPGGTDDIDSTVYEGVVITTITDENVKEDNPGVIRTIISTDPIKLPFGKADTNVTLLLYDRVEFQLLTNVITKEQRATNIKPKAPDTFQLTKEIREMGVIMNKTDGALTLMTETHDNLKASAVDRLTDDELNVMDEVEFTILTVNDTKKAVRLKKLPEGSVTFNQAKGSEKDITSCITPVKDKWKPVNMEASSQSFDVSSEKYEGTVAKLALKKSQTQEKEADEQEPTVGLLVTTVEGTDKRLSFRSGDVITKATMMIGDKVQFNLSTNTTTKEESAVNLEILPETFQTDSQEQRKIGLVTKLDDNFGFIKTQQDPQLFFDISEVMEDTKLALSEKVEFTLVPKETAEGGNQAVRIRRLNESVFTSAPKLEAFGVKEKKKMTIKLLKETKEPTKEEGKGSESTDVDKTDQGKVKALPSVSSVKDPKKGSDTKQGDRARSRSRENSRRRYSRSRSRSRESGRRKYSRSRSRSRSRDRSRSYYGKYSSSHEKKESRYRYKRSRSRSRERSDRYRRSRSRSRSRERSTRNKSRSPDKYDRYSKQSSSKDSSSKKRAKSPDNVDDELLRKRRELMELNELIARRKAIVAMEQNVKKFEPEVEVDEKSGVKTFDYQHMHRENVWMPDLKPVKSILKKSAPQTDSQSQASASKEPTFIKSESQEMEIGSHQQTSAFQSNTSGFSTFSYDSEKTLAIAGSEMMPLPGIQDSELVKKKKQLEELSESIARKRALIALEQKIAQEVPKVEKEYQNVPKVKIEYDFDSQTEDQCVISKGSLWSSKEKPDVQPKKSILKKHSEILGPQCDTPSVDDYGQPCQDDAAFTKPPSQAPTPSLFNPHPIHSGSLASLKKSSAASLVPENPLFKGLVVPQSVMQASSSKSLHDQKSSSMSKGNNVPSDPHEASSSQSHDQPQSSKPSTSQMSASDKKRNLTTQMERFLSALNRADSSIVNSLFQEARKDQALINAKRPTQVDKKIPFMDEIYDPFKEDEDSDQPSLRAKHFGGETVKSPVQVETCLNDPGNDDLLPHERAVQDGSGFSRLVGMKQGVDPTAKIEKSPYGHLFFSENWNTRKEDPNSFSEQWRQYEQDTDLYTTEHKQYTNDRSQSRERSQSVQHPNVQHSYAEDKELPHAFEKSLARQQSEESNEENERKLENFEKIQSLLQTIGLHLDTAEVSKLADRTQERLYGKMKRPVSTHSFDQKRERSVSQSDRRDSSSRADSSESEGFRSVSPAQSSNRKVYMSYKELKHKDEHKMDSDLDLTCIKRTIVNVKPTEEGPYNSSQQTVLSQNLLQPGASATVQPDSSQYAQNSTVPTYSAAQYSQYQSSNQHVWGMYQYGTVPPSTNLSYVSGHQMIPPHMMATYSPYTGQMANPYCVPHPVSMPNAYGSVPIPYTNQVASHAPTRCLKTIETVKTVKTVKAVKAPHTGALVSIQPTEDSQAKCTSEEAKNTQVATLTEDEIKAKQKKRLEQFNLRMKQKKEQQMEAQRSRGQNQNSAPGKSAPSEIKNVWICGHGLVLWAEKRTTSNEYGVQLGMHPSCVRIWWKGVQGMTWQQLIPLLLQLNDNWPKPDVLIIHLGGNDISTTAPEAFLETVKKDLISLKSIFPDCLLVWSSILWRRSWRGKEDSAEMDIIRMAVNESIETIMTDFGGLAVSHSNIKPSVGLYRPDGIHLSGKGIDVFKLNLQAVLEKWESETNNKESPSV